MGMNVKEAILALKANAIIACERAGFSSVTVRMIEDALDTIKDALKEQPEIVRCKDCKDRFNGRCYSRKSDRVNFGVDVPDDWFCADGVRKEGR